MQYPKSYIAWDLETTGFSPANDRIVEIGAMVVKDGEVISEWSWLLNHPGLDIPEAATNVHGITNEEMRSKGKDPDECLRLFMDLFSENGYYNLTHNGIKFDIPFLRAELNRSGMADSTDERIKKVKDRAVDSAVLYKAQHIQARRFEAENFLEFANRVMAVRAYGVKFNVKYLTEKLGIKVDGDLHRALVDVKATHEIYQKFIT